MESSRLWNSCHGLKSKLAFKKSKNYSFNWDFPLASVQNVETAAVGIRKSPCKCLSSLSLSCHDLFIRSVNNKTLKYKLNLGHTAESGQSAPSLIKQTHKRVSMWGKEAKNTCWLCTGVSCVYYSHLWGSFWRPPPSHGTAGPWNWHMVLKIFAALDFQQSLSSLFQAVKQASIFYVVYTSSCTNYWKTKFYSTMQQPKTVKQQIASALSFSNFRSCFYLLIVLEDESFCWHHQDFICFNSSQDTMIHRPFPLSLRQTNSETLMWLLPLRK